MPRFFRRKTPSMHATRTSQNAAPGLLRIGGLRPTLLAAGLLLLAACGGDLDARIEALRDEIQAGRAAEVVEPLRRLVDEHPDRADAQHLLGVAYLQTGQVGLAIWPLEKAAEDPDFVVPSNLVLASALLATENFDGAVEAATRVLEKDPSQTAVLHTRARAHLGAARAAEALADADRLLALDPESYDAVLLRAASLSDLDRNDEAEEAYRRLRQVGALDSPENSARGCLALATFYAEDREDVRRAEAVIEECLEEHPTDTLTVKLATDFFDRKGDAERSDALLRDAIAKAPEELALRATLANRLVRDGKVEEAEQLLRETAEQQPGAESWRMLSDLYRELDRPAEALDALARMEALMPVGSDLEQLRFRQADLSIDAGDLDRAEAFAAQLQKPEYRDLIRGRILLERGDPAASLVAFEEGTKLWPNNAYARYLAGRAAMAAGDREKATKHLREATRADAAATDAALVLARLYLDEGRYEDVIGMTKRHLESRSAGATEAFRLAARAYQSLGYTPRALRALVDAETLGADRVEIAIERAAILRSAEGSAAAREAIEESSIDLRSAEGLALLRVLVGDLLAAGAADEARARVDAAVKAQGETPEVLALRGRVRARSGDEAGAREDWQAALAAAPDQPSALVGMAWLAGRAGSVDEAVALYDRAAPNEPTAAYRAAQLLMAAGRTADAEARLREIVAEEPGQSFAANDLAWLLAEQGRDLEFALDLADRAARLSPSADVLDTLAWVQLKSGRPEAASISFRKALEQAPANPTIWYHLGLAQLAKGDDAAAREALTKALEHGPFADADAAREAIARLDADAAGEEG